MHLYYTSEFIYIPHNCKKTYNLKSGNYTSVKSEFQRFEIVHKCVKELQMIVTVVTMK